MQGNFKNPYVYIPKLEFHQSMQLYTRNGRAHDSQLVATVAIYVLLHNVIVLKTHSIACIVLALYDIAK